MSNITKELQNSKKQQLKETETNNVIKEVKQLIDSDAQEDLRIFRALGKNHSITVSEDEIGKRLELEKLDGKYAGNVFNIAQIKDLAIRYNLRFLPSKLYEGKMDIMVASKIREFARDTQTEITNGALEYNFLILAPEKSFKLIGERRRKIWESKDPAIFYKIDDKHYKLIHKWGSDFTIFNRIKGLLNLSWQVSFLVNFVIAIALLSAGSFAVSKVVNINSLMTYWWTIPCSAFLFAFFAQLGRLSDVFDQDNDYYSPSKWNKEVKLS